MVKLLPSVQAVSRTDRTPSGLPSAVDTGLLSAAYLHVTRRPITRTV